MHKYRFFTLPELINEDEALLPKDEAHHAQNVLRLNVSDKAVLFDGTGVVYLAEVRKICPLKFKILKKEHYLPKKELNVCVGLAKSKKLDLIVRQLTEIGCSKITIFSSKRSIPLLSKEKEGKRLDRWRKISIAAAKQSRRQSLPKINFFKWNDFIKSFEGHVFTLYEEGGLPLNDCLAASLNKATLIIGPEGGFERAEISELEKTGSEICSTGKYILRVETAAVFAASVAAVLMEI